MTYIPLSELHPFPNHPFKVRDDDAMSEMTESIMEYGILTPAIVRPRDEGGYEIVAGHRRKHACELAGLDTLPAIVRELDSDMATILMVDSNIQREDVLPSEKAQAYKMKLEAIKRQGARTDRTCDQVGHKLSGKKSVEIIADESGESKTQVQRYIRLTALSPQLQQMVDDKEIAVTPAVELSETGGTADGDGRYRQRPFNSLARPGTAAQEDQPVGRAGYGGPAVCHDGREETKAVSASPRKAGHASPGRHFTAASPGHAPGTAALPAGRQELRHHPGERPGPQKHGQGLQLYPGYISRRDYRVCQTLPE